MKVVHLTEGTPGNGIGVSIQMSADSLSDNTSSVSTISGSFSSITDGSEMSKLTLSTRGGSDSNAMNDVVAIDRIGINLLKSTDSLTVKTNDVLNGTHLGKNVVTSKLTTLGTLDNLTVNGDITAKNSVSISTLKLGSALTASAAELNILDGVLTNPSSFNLLSGSSSASVNNGKVAVYDSNGKIGSSTAQASLEDNISNKATTVLHLSHRVSNTAATGLASNFRMESENVAGSKHAVGVVSGVLQKPDDSIIGRLDFNSADNTAFSKTSISKLLFDLQDGELRINNQPLLGKLSLSSPVKSSSLETLGKLSSLTVAGKLSVQDEIESSNGANLDILSSQGVLVETVKLSNRAVSSVGTLTVSDDVKFTSTAASSTETNGGLVVSGGVGIKGALFVKENVVTSGSILTTSDARYKENIRQIKNASDLIKAITGVLYKYRYRQYPKMKFPRTEQIGLIAQEVNDVFPQIIRQNSDGFLSVSYSSLNAVLIEVFKENQEKIDKLEGLLQALKQKVPDHEMRTLRTPPPMPQSTDAIIMIRADFEEAINRIWQNFQTNPRKIALCTCVWLFYVFFALRSYFQHSSIVL
jgi:hypothetical protein